MSPYKATKRDRFAVWLANRCLRLASADYRRIVKGAIALGLLHGSANVYTDPNTGTTTTARVRGTYVTNWP